MPYMGAPPFVRDPIDVLIDRRFRLNRGLPPEVEESLNANPPEAGPSQPGLFRQIGRDIFSQRGLSSIGAGLRASRGARNFGEAFAAGLGGSLEAGGELARQQAAQELEAQRKQQEYDLDVRRVAADEQRAKAAETTASKAGIGRETTAQELEAEYDFLSSLPGMTDEALLEHFKNRRGRGAGAGGGRETDLMRVAAGLVASGRAPDINTAYVMARTLGQQPQIVGSIERVVLDDQLNEITRRVTVSRRINPITGQFELIDEAGNLLTDEDLQSFRQAGEMQPFVNPETGQTIERPIQYFGGRGGPANPPSTRRGGALPDSTQGAPISSFEPAPSHSQTFAQGEGGVDEATIINLISDPNEVQDVNTLRAYATGQGPAGDSAMIRQAALARLRALGVTR